MTAPSDVKNVPGGRNTRDGAGPLPAMTIDTHRSQEINETKTGSIDHVRAKNRFPSLSKPRCRKILNIVAETGWTTDQDIRSQLELNEENQRECLSQLRTDGFVELIGTGERQFIRLTQRGEWAIDTHTDDPAGPVEESEA